MTETIHACPPGLSGVTPCCGRTPFELPRTDCMTVDPQAVTCPGRPAPAPALPQCPTCGLTPTEPHPRRAGVDRCANCKEHAPGVAPIPGRCNGCGRADDEGCGCPVHAFVSREHCHRCDGTWLIKNAADKPTVADAQAMLRRMAADAARSPVRCPHCDAGPIPSTHWTKHLQRHHPNVRHAPAPDGLRDLYAAAIRSCVEGGNVRYGHLADAVLAVRDEELQRAQATVERVSAECDRIEAAVRANPQDPDFDGAYLAAIGHIRNALTPQEPTS